MQAFRSSSLAFVTDIDAVKPAAEDAAGLARWLTRLHPRAMRYPMACGTHVFSEDDELDHLYFLVRGWALRYKSLFDGHRQVLDFALPGDVLGFVGERRVTGDASRPNIEIAAPIRQLHIADALGLRGETVCRVLKRLARANIATFRQGFLHIPDLDELRRVAETPDAEGPLIRATPRCDAAVPRESTPVAA